MGYKIRSLQNKDFPTVEKIFREHTRHAETGESLEDELAEISRCLHGSPDIDGRELSFLVATNSEGTVVGCAAHCDPTDFVRKHFGLGKGEARELLYLYVSADASKGQGIGRSLVESLCRRLRAKGFSKLVVCSGPRYRTAWGFYDKVFDAGAGEIAMVYPDGTVKAKTWIKYL